MRPLTGDLADGKGMALFSRQIGVRYMAIGRQDSENLWLFASDDMFDWRDGTKIIEPAEAWEFVQLGNCGSPIEIDEGRSEEHTSELQSLLRNSTATYCLKKKTHYT